MHPDLGALTFLLGTWRGSGRGEYPTIDPFRYDEEVVVEHVGDPYLLFAQSSWLSGDHAPLPFERGFLRPGTEPREVELCLAHPLGLTEIAHGTLEGTSIDLSTASEGIVARTRSGSAVTGLTRRYVVENDVLTYQLFMATEDTAISLHLRGTLRRRS